MTKMLTFPYKARAIKVQQPLGEFYVTVLPARLLLDVAYSDALFATLRESRTSYELKGTQRLAQPKRIQPIADYINRIDSAFPNAIILAANFRQEDGLIEDEDWSEDDVATTLVHHKQWTIEEDGEDCFLMIPSAEKLAAIIDGQHRLFAFTHADSERLNMDMVCSVFLDLPKPFQAQLFATINSTQKPVDKSLTYELFGYNLEEESEGYWSPDKLAVFLTRKLGTEDGSPLKGRIVIAPKRDRALDKLAEGKSWRVSTAVVVEGIMRLITSNPKKDSTHLLAVQRKTRKDIADFRTDKSPLRDAYINSQDAILYHMTLNYLKACDEVFWSKAPPGSFIIKTVGIQALFDILRIHAAKIFEGRDIRVAFFVSMLTPAANIDFASDTYRNASGSGRTMIKKAIAEVVTVEPVSA